MFKKKVKAIWTLLTNCGRKLTLIQTIKVNYANVVGSGLLTKLCV